MPEPDCCCEPLSQLPACAVAWYHSYHGASYPRRWPPSRPTDDGHFSRTSERTSASGGSRGGASQDWGGRGYQDRASSRGGFAIES
eukprot:scaffold7228_cov523-Prasinococcus_capsulatus_cf.AAC.13